LEKDKPLANELFIFFLLSGVLYLHESRSGPAKHADLPGLLARKRRADAHGRLPLFLDLPELQREGEAQSRGLLRVLQLWDRPLPAEAG
jgi:hypothetical protein